MHESLTVFPVISDLYLLFLGPLDGLLDELDGIRSGQWAVEEVAVGGLLHGFGPPVPRQLAKPVVAEYYGFLRHLGICNYEVPI